LAIISPIEGIRKTEVRRTKMFISKDDAEDKNAGVTKVAYPNCLLYGFKKAPKTRFQDEKTPLNSLI